MFPPLDIRTLSIASGVISLSLGVCMLYVLTTHRVWPGFKRWTAGSLCTGAGFVLMAFRDVIPDLFTVLVANGLIYGYFALVSRGIADFFGLRAKIPWEAIGLVVLMVLFLHYTYFAPNVRVRIVVFSASVAPIIGLAALRVRRGAAHRTTAGYGLLRAVFALTALWFAGRAALVVVHPDTIESFMTAGVLHAMTFLVYSSASTFITVALILANVRRLEEEIEHAEGQIETLSELLPICSSCKSVRDDKGYWKKIEAYLTAHRDAKLSHGLCPSCIERLYPDL